MKSLRTFGYVLFVLTTNVVIYSQVRIETTMSLTNERGNLISVHCGIDSGATDGIDEKLGEFAFPAHPPGGLHCAYIISDSVGSVLSYRDLRKFPAEKQFMIEHTLSLSPFGDTTRGSTIMLTWHYPLNQNIDSIVVVDFFDGLIKKIKLDSREVDTLGGNASSLEKYHVRVYYNLSSTNAESENKSASDGFLIQNKTLSFLGDDSPIECFATNVLGQNIYLPLDVKAINLSGLQVGCYVISVSFRNGCQKTIKYLSQGG